MKHQGFPKKATNMIRSLKKINKIFKMEKFNRGEENITTVANYVTKEANV